MNRSAFAVLVALAGLALAAGADAAPPSTKPAPTPQPQLKPVKPLPVKPTLNVPAGSCSSASPDLRIELGSATSKTATVEANIYGQAHERECPRTAIVDFVATKASYSPLPPAPAPQSWLSTFSVQVWDSRTTSLGDVLDLKGPTAASCAAYSQTIKLLQLTTPGQPGFTPVFEGPFVGQMTMDGSHCFLSPPRRGFRAQAPNVDGTTITYRVLLDAPVGTVSARFAHDQTNRGE